MDLIKKLKEDKEEIVTELKELRDNEENVEISEETLVEKRAELKMIDRTIAGLEEKLRVDTVVIEEKGEDEKMEKNLEIRGLEDYIKGKQVRSDSIAITDDGAATIPTLVEDNIIKKLDNFSDVFAAARKLPSQAGTLKIPRENSIAIAGFVGELENVDAINLDLGEVELTQKRVGAYTGVTNQLVNDAAVDIIEYAEDRLARGAARAIEKSIFGGKGDIAKDFKGIAEDEDVEVIETNVIDLDTLITVHNSLHPEFLPSAKFYVSRELYDVISKLKDTNNHPYVQNGIVNGTLTKILFDIPISATDFLPEGTPLILGSIDQGYSIMIKKGMKLQHITGDSRNALRGTQMLVLDAYMDGAVHDPQAFVVLKENTKIGG